MKFEVLNRSEIDVSKWAETIKNSTCPLIYGNVHFLDCVFDNDWNALVFDDYSAVFPFFEKKNLLFKRLVQPRMTQQSGLFIHTDSFKNKDLYLKKSLEYLLHQNMVGEITLNECNWISCFPNEIKVVPRTNYILDLNRSYSLIRERYNKNMRKKLSKNFDYVIESLSGENLTIEVIKKIITHYKENVNIKYIRKNETFIFNLFKSLHNIDGIGMEAVVVKDENQEFISSSLFISFENRIVYLLGSVNQKGRDSNAFSFTLDFIIQKYAEQPYHFDFEGSDIPGVKEFFLSFRPTERKYPQLYWDKTAGIYTLAKKVKHQLHQ